jgi:predicted transcriptional regulator
MMPYTEQLKTLRARRGDSSKENAERVKAQNRMQQAVLKAIETEAKTVPEIAAETGLSTQDVFWWITALRKYNKVQDEKKRGDYMAYRKK